MGRRELRKKNKKQYPIYLGIALGLCLLAGGSYYATTRIFQENKTSETSEIVKESSTEATSHKIESTVNSSDEKTTATTEEIQSVQLDASQLEANASQVAYGAYYFDSGKTISNDNTQPMIAASIIKVFVMDYAYSQISNGSLTTETMIQGATLDSWIYPMIQQSSNEAANVLIDYFGMEQLNFYFQTQGYTNTRIERKMLDYTAQGAGKENYTSLNDCLAFLKKIYTNQTTYPSSQMLTILKGQGIQTKIPSKLPTGTVVANKTGELAGVENDIALVFSEKAPFALVVLTNSVINSEGLRSAIGDFALACYQA
ncbi:serine hydrolase [Enterococcus sp. AZ103]|uniref:serine hydrolase n=1 Tax=Enterococcus sp. AZ103 TaxID=2774628 RepID=UPI003F226104